jgi:PAS domain S-box-containing protein
MLSPLLNVLCLEDNPADAELVRRMLKKEGYTMQFELVTMKKEYFEKISSGNYDLILCDYNLPGYSGLDALNHAKQTCPDVPFICVSGMIGEYHAVELLKNGAADYVMKNQLDKLPFAVHRALKEVEEHKARKAAENELRKLSQAVHQSPVSIIITDETGIVQYVNPKTTEFTEFKTEELVGQKSWFYISDEKSKEEYQELWQTIRSGNEWKGEFYRVRKNGDQYWESAAITPILDEYGEITNYLVFREDITGRKEFLMELVKAKLKAESGDRLKTAFINNNIKLSNSWIDNIFPNFNTYHS